MMFDKLTPEERSALMRMIRGKDTKPELLVRRYLHGMGLRYRLHDARLPGRPDIVLSSRRVVIFVQGCFWHCHGAGCGIRPGRPRVNASYWEAKLASNVARDARQRQALESAGWRVLTIWECGLRRKERGATLRWLLKEITVGDVFVTDEPWNELRLAA